MKFSLITPPTDAPSRIPLSRGLPSASASAVNTSALPNALPLPALDPDAVAMPYQALARFAASGLQASSDVSTLILAAEAKKRDANDTAEIDRLYTDMTVGVDTDFAKMKISETDETLVPAFNAMWKTRMDAALAQASNKSVQAGLVAKANGLLRVKSGEVTSTSTKKFVERQTAEYQQTVKTLTDLATNPALTPAEQAIHQAELERRFLTAGNSGLFPKDDVAKQRTETMNFINQERASTRAYLDPMGTLEEMSAGETYGLASKPLRGIIDAATQQLRVQRQDREHAENEAAKRRKDLQAQDTVALRRRITENWGPDGKRVSMVSEINAQAMRLGDDNYKSLLETERTYQALATKAAPKRESSTDLKGELQAKLTANGNWRSVSQADLLRMLKAHAAGGEGLDADDHRYFSNKLDELTEKAKRPEPETEEEKIRKGKIVDAAKTIETFIERGSKFESRPSEILARDAVIEMKRLAAANPDMDPDDIATQMIAKKIAQYEDLVTGLPYQTKEEVLKAWKQGLIPTKREADRYFLIFDMIEKNKPSKPSKTETPPPTGFLGGVKQWLGIGETTPETTLPTKKRKTP